MDNVVGQHALMQNKKQERTIMEPNIVSKKLLNRLPVYLDYLKTLPDSSENISAAAIARDLDMGEVQVRKDLAKVSHTGRCRTGRSRAQLIQDIEAFLDFTAETGTIVVGTGPLGQALLDYSGFENPGLNMMAGFDICPPAQQSRGGKPIYPMNRLETFCRHYNVHVGIIAVPAHIAQNICDALVACGVHAIWNFAPVRLKVPDYIVVRNENLAFSPASPRLQMHIPE